MRKGTRFVKRRGAPPALAFRRALRHREGAMADTPNPARGTSAEAERKARLAANLRANLRRRKAQARAMEAGEVKRDE